VRVQCRCHITLTPQASHRRPGKVLQAVHRVVAGRRGGGGAAHLVALGVGELARKRNRRDLRSLRRVLGGTLGLEELRLLELLDDLGVEV